MHKDIGSWRRDCSISPIASRSYERETIDSLIRTFKSENLPAGRVSTCPITHSASGKLGANMDVGLTPPGHIVDDELHEVLVTIADDHVFDAVGGRVSRP